MRYIWKRPEPQALAKWRRRHPHSHYKNLQDDDVRQSIRQSCLQEQHQLCCYCCRSLCEHKHHIEHLLPQALYPERSLCYANILVSCEDRNRCGRKKGNREIPLSPLLPECESEISFRLSGRAKGSTERAQQTVGTLGLNGDKLVGMRRQIIHFAILQETGAGPKKMSDLPQPEGNEILQGLRQQHQKQDRFESVVLCRSLDAYLNTDESGK